MNEQIDAAVKVLGPPALVALALLALALLWLALRVARRRGKERSPHDRRATGRGEGGE